MRLGYATPELGTFIEAEDVNSVGMYLEEPAAVIFTSC